MAFMDNDTFSVLRPMRATIAGGEHAICTPPKGKHNLYTIWDIRFLWLLMTQMAFVVFLKYCLFVFLQA